MTLLKRLHDNFFAQWVGWSLFCAVMMAFLLNYTGTTSVTVRDNLLDWRIYAFDAMMGFIFGGFYWATTTSKRPVQKERSPLMAWIVKWRPALWWGGLSLAVYFSPLHGSERNWAEIPLSIFAGGVFTLFGWAFLHTRTVRGKDESVAEQRARFAERLNKAAARYRDKSDLPLANHVSEAYLAICRLILEQNGYWPAHFRDYARGRLIENSTMISALNWGNDIDENPYEGFHFIQAILVLIVADELDVERIEGGLSTIETKMAS